MGTRSKARKRAIDILYEADLREMDAQEVLADRVGSIEVAPVREYAVTLVEGVVRNRRRIDEVLVEHSEGWALGRMPAVDRAVLRLGLYELIWGEDVPDAVAIDEAVELVKSLSTDDSPKFINGVLGRVAGISDRLRESAPGTGAPEIETHDYAPVHGAAADNDVLDDDTFDSDESDSEVAEDGGSEAGTPGSGGPVSDTSRTGVPGTDAPTAGAQETEAPETEASGNGAPEARAPETRVSDVDMSDAEENGQEAGQSVE